MAWLDTNHERHLPPLLSLRLSPAPARLFLIDQANTHAAVAGRDDGGIVDARLGGRDRRIVGIDRSDNRAPRRCPSATMSTTKWCEAAITRALGAGKPLDGLGALHGGKSAEAMAAGAE